MRIEVYDRGDFSVWTKQRSNELPAVRPRQHHLDLSSTTSAGDTGPPRVDEHHHRRRHGRRQLGPTRRTIGLTDEHLETVLINRPAPQRLQLPRCRQP